MDWNKTRAKRVCDVCFRGDAVGMRDYAATYLKEGFKAVRPLGASFRDLLPGRARSEFWEKAMRQLNDHLDHQATVSTAGDKTLPPWTIGAGGTDRWKRWIVKKAGACFRRAKKLAEKRGISRRLPTKAEWRHAIVIAVQQSDGRGHFSRLPLSLDTCRNEKHACWPSIEHLDGTFSTNVAIELRIFNDVKTILTIAELRRVVGHLAVTMNAPLVRLDDNWECDRSYAVEQPSDEPPLPRS
jgi:hypothetical protein